VSCVRCRQGRLDCVPQAGRPGARACVPCSAAKAKCSLAEEPISGGESVMPRGRGRGVSQDRLVAAVEGIALAHKKSAEAMDRLAVAMEDMKVSMATMAGRAPTIRGSGPAMRPVVEIESRREGSGGVRPMKRPRTEPSAEEEVERIATLEEVME
jgi:hypothetical protein